MKQSLRTSCGNSLYGPKTILASLDRKKSKFYEYHNKNIGPYREFFILIFLTDDLLRNAFTRFGAGPTAGGGDGEWKEKEERESLKIY